MSGEGHLPRLEEMLDDAARRYKRDDEAHPGGPPAAYWHGQARAFCRAISLISRCSPEYEWKASLRRIGANQ